MKKSTLLLLLFLPFSLLSAQSIEGVYDTDFNEMTLQIQGEKVTGTYKYSDGRIEGVLNGHTLTGWWYQSNGKGRLTFVFDADFCSFQGLWSYNDADPGSAWNGTKTGTHTKTEVLLVAGIYQTDFNEMTLKQKGDKVSGTYEFQNGRIEGIIKGNTLIGRWYQSNRKGRLVFEFDANGTAFKGRWGYDDAEPTEEWNGSKMN